MDSNSITFLVVEDSPVIHEELGTNLCYEDSGTAGDPDKAFEEADGVVSASTDGPNRFKILSTPCQNKLT